MIIFSERINGMYRDVRKAINEKEKGVVEELAREQVAGGADIMDINLKGLFFICQAAGRVMIRQKSGKIVNISSQAGSVALRYRVAYCSSKGGVDQLTRTLAYEWARYGINVNAVAPTFVITPMTRGMLDAPEFAEYVLGNIPLGRVAEAEEIAYSVLFLSSPLSDMITGHILMVDGGWTIK